MCDYKTIDEKITELAEINSLNVIKGYAEMGDVDSILKEAEVLAYRRSYAHFIERELRKKIEYLYQCGFDLEKRVAELENKLDDK